MKTGIGKFLQINTANRPMILALLVQAGCTGIFAGTMELAGTVLFLESHDAERIPLALMISGAAGILIASIYTYFSRHLRVKSFGVLNLAAVIITTGVLFAGSRILHKSHFDFLLFVLMGPLLLVTVLGFWITVHSFLTPSKGKELSGLVEAALMAGMVLAFLAAPLVVYFGISLQLVLLAGMISMIIAALAQLFVLNGMGNRQVYPKGRVGSAGPIRLFSHRYTGLISAFVLLGVAVAVVLHFSFLWSASTHHADHGDLLSFLGIFFAAMAALGWITKRRIFGWIKKHYGIGVTVLMTPVILLLISLAIVIVGDIYGYGSGTLLVSYFFMMVFVARFILGTGIAALQDPSMNVIYQSLDPREKNNIKSGIEGVLSQIGVFGIALFLVSFVMISFIELIHITYLLIILIMAWFFVGLTLLRSYKRMLRVSLESDRIRDQIDRSLQELSTVDLQATAFPVESLVFNPFFFHFRSREELTGLLDHAHPGVRMRVWDHLLANSPGLPQLTLSQMAGAEHEPLIREKIRKFSQRKLRSKLGLQEAFIRERLDRFRDESGRADPAIDEAFQSGERNEVIAALYHVAKEVDHSFLPEVVSLLRDKDLDVRSVAISTAGQINSRRVTGSLIECLEHPSLYPMAWSALVRLGEVVLEDLETVFHQPASDCRLQKRLVSIMAAIGGEKAMEYLIGKLDYHQRDVFGAVVLGLYENHFRANDLQAATVQTAIMKLVHAGAWNLAAKVSMRMENPGGMVDVALEHETWSVNERILMLLALIYDRRSVHRIRMNLLDKQAVDRGMAIELLDLLLKEPLKSEIHSYFSDVLVREKIDRLQMVDRVDLIPVDVLLRKILNRDGMQMGDFIRVCVLERMGNDERYFDEQQIIAQGFHPNSRIRVTAAQILRKKDPGRFDLVTERLDFADNSFPDHEDSAAWYVDTTIKLAAWKLFKNVEINSLFELVSILQPYSKYSVSKGDMLVLVRSEEGTGHTLLEGGIAIIAADHPEILDQIHYLEADGKAEAFMAEQDQFVGLLFDDRRLLEVVSNFLNQSGSRLV